MNVTALQLGAPFEGGFYGGDIRIRDAVFAIVTAPKAEGETRGAWLGKYTDVPGARSCFDSMANTIAMAEAGSEIAKKALACSIGGKTDWCIGARDVVEVLYRNKKPGTWKNLCSFRDGDNASSVPVGYPYTEDSPAQTSVAAFQKSGAEAFEEDWYWSSTQYSEDSAFFQNFDYGLQSGDGKKFEGLVRFVRRLPVNPSVLSVGVAQAAEVAA